MPIPINDSCSYAVDTILPEIMGPSYVPDMASNMCQIGRLPDTGRILDTGPKGPNSPWEQLPALAIMHSAPQQARHHAYQTPLGPSAPLPCTVFWHKQK